MKNLALTAALLLAVLIAAGCYTQVGYYESRFEKPSAYRQHKKDLEEQSKHDKRARLESKPEEGVEREDTDADRVHVEEDEGYYGRRKPAYSRYPRYHRPYYRYHRPFYYDYYYPPTYRYYPYYPYYSYGGYYSFYPYRPYRYSGYHRHYGGKYGRHHRYGGTRSSRTYKNRDAHHGKKRSRQYRGRSH